MTLSVLLTISGQIRDLRRHSVLSCITVLLNISKTDQRPEYSVRRAFVQTKSPGDFHKSCSFPLGQELKRSE